MKPKDDKPPAPRTKELSMHATADKPATDVEPDADRIGDEGTREVFRSIIRDCIEEADDAASRKVLARAKVREWPGLVDSLIDWLIDTAVNRQVDEQTHRGNQVVKRNHCTRGYDAIAAAGEAAALSVLDGMNIQGRRLGDILCDELPKIAADETRVGDEHRVNAALLMAIHDRAKGKGQVAVRHVVTEKQASDLLRRIKNAQAEGRE